MRIIQFQSNSGFIVQYTSENEGVLRYNNFKDFLALVDDRNAAEVAAGGTYGTHGITKFADLSQAEFESTYLGFRMLNSTETSGDNSLYYYESVMATDGLNGAGFAPSLADTTVRYVNWAGIYTGAVQDQGGVE